MEWWFIAVDVLAAAVVAWLVLNILASVLRACGATWARLPNLDYLAKWVVLALSVLSIAPRLDWTDPVLRNLVLGYGAFCLLIVGMSIYGRLFVLPKLNERPATPRTPPPDRITTGMFQGWSARVARRTCIGAAIFVLAGSVAGQLFVRGHTIFGGLAAAVALFCMPYGVILAMMPWMKSVGAHNESNV